MEDINKLVLIARLTKDAELKYTNSGTAVTRLGLATNRSRKDGDQWVEEASFLDATYWGKRGEKLNQYLTKGTRVCIEGSIKQERWEQDGQTRSRVIIHIDNLQLLGGNQQGQQSNQGGYGSHQQQGNTGGYDQCNPTYTRDQGGTGNFESDIPFMRSDLECRF